MQTLKEPQIVQNRPGSLTSLISVQLLIGYALLAVSFTCFIISEMAARENKEWLFTIFVLHYLIAAAYSVVLIYHGSLGVIRSWKRENISKTIVLLLLYLISAYALNRELPVFQDSTTWLCAYLVVSSIVMLSMHFQKVIPAWLAAIQLIILGSAIVFYSYLAIYVANHYVVGFIGIILLGIGAHIFVPIFLIIGVITLARHQCKGRDFLWLGAGAVATILYCVSFVAEWNNRVTRIDQIARESVMYPEIELPLWVRLGETLPNDWITDRMLKTDLVYTSAQRSTEWFSVPSTTWVETKKHDPFVILGTMITKTSLSDEDRISILRSISDSRHRSHERLWSGDNLVTSNIVTDIDIYRDHHLAYTEKYLDIKNMSTRNRWWGNTEEALYTFRMPEGSVVTSLSLWVNGKEEKAILTSKGKATEAYETIVGKERRDPSVVHWQEGNTVVVRVFPCTPSEQRKVKIGFTSPLRETDGSLRYQNITFEGPSANEAKETVRVRIVGDRTLQLEGFRQDTNGDWISENDYDPDFEISVPATALKVNNRFSFLGNSYHVEKYVPTYEDVTIENIFLDINSSWTNSEVDACRDLVGQRSIYVYHNNNFVPITSENWDIVEQLRSRNYSLFPIHRLKQAPESLVITKGSAISPHLADLKETAFANSMNRFFAKGRKIRVFNFGEESSNFISSLRELRALSFATGDEKELARIVSGKFPINQESENQVVLHDAALKIVQVPQADQSEPSGGPDHLYRLFAYNNIMRQAGPFYFGKADPKGLVEDAARAYVVSPFSSLIVLETQQDYDRFGIKDIDNSLKNASKQSSGAVPEPHEWALIMLCVLVALYVKFRR